jgi:hypothetical protein
MKIAIIVLNSNKTLKTKKHINEAKMKSVCVHLHTPRQWGKNDRFSERNSCRDFISRDVNNG